QASNEPGVPNVKVELMDDEGNLLATTYTSTMGYYNFNNLDQGYYVVKFSQLPANFEFSAANQGTNGEMDSDADVTTGLSDTLAIYPGDMITSIDAGVHSINPNASAQLGNWVWYDLDNNGLQGTSEAGASGITVTLYNAMNGLIVGTTVTDATGYYTFVGLAAGDYQVKFSNLPASYVLANANTGTNDALDSDADMLTGETAVINLSAGEIDMTIDAGISPSLGYMGFSCLGDRVWYDANQNGLQDANETGVANVNVELYDANGTVLATTTTDVTGTYMFNSLGGGQYKVKFTNLPVGYSFSSANAGNNEELDSDADATGMTALISLPLGQYIGSLDAGIFAPTGNGAIGDFVWNDQNQDGIQNNNETGVKGVAVTLHRSNGQVLSSTVTDNNGHYLFNGLLEDNYYISFSNLPTGFHFTTPNNTSNDQLDSDADTTSGTTAIFHLGADSTRTDIDAGLFSNRAIIGDYVWLDEDYDGVQDANEAGVAGVTVKLFDNNNQWVSTSITDATGKYLFVNLTPGTYYVNFSNKPVSTHFAPADQGNNDAIDSDVNIATGNTPPVTVAAGDINTTLDAGLQNIIPLSLTGLAWFDKNGDGMRQGSETKIPSVMVKVLNSNNQVVAATVTNNQGWYYFNNLPAGTYNLVFSNFPNGSTITLPNVGSNDTLNSDANVVTGKTIIPITMVNGVHKRGLDVGVLPPGSIRGTTFADENAIPNGLQEPYEPVIQGVTVMLYMADGTPIAVTYTDKYGNYAFTGLPEGDYYVEFEQVSGRELTIQDVDSNVTDDLDSDANPLTFTSHTVSLGVGEHIINIDAGYLPGGAIFPIELLSFTAELVNTDGHLKWVTSSESNSDHFEVFRSIDGKQSFERIVEYVQAQGNSQVNVTYDKTYDRNVSLLNIDKIYYRLKMVDTDGQFKWSNTVELQLQHLDRSIFLNVYPNPAQNDIYIDYQLFDAEFADIRLVDAAGRAVYEANNLQAGASVQQHHIDVEKLATGIYYLQIQTEESSAVRKIVVE
ncbi:MAG: SdrD B-like domain-containing protein, partial [Bacteroidia bacterium]